MSMLNIAVLADYNADFEPHPQLFMALRHSAAVLSQGVRQAWIPTSLLDRFRSDEWPLYDGVVVGPGSPFRNEEAVIGSIRTLREGGIPTMGTCAGYQHMSLEFLRNAAGVPDAVSSQYPHAKGTIAVAPLPCSLRGKTLALRVAPASAAGRAYGGVAGEERYYCSFGVLPEYLTRLQTHGFVPSAWDRDDGTPRILEVPGHPFFVGTVFVPQARSTESSPHPLITDFLRAASRTKQRAAAE